MMWFYNTADPLRFVDVQNQLDALKGRGIRFLIFYAPYHGDPEMWLGCDPLDFFTTPPQSGTLQDWKNLVAAAHARGMKVGSYFVNIYIDQRSQFFRTAEAQYRAGDRTSREVSTFHWTTNPDQELPYAAAGGNEWLRSTTASSPGNDVYYWSNWGMAGFDFALPGARAEIERVEKFWLDTGMDGFMWDAVDAHPDFKHHLSDYPKNHSSSDKWLTFEVTDSELEQEYDQFGLTSWFSRYDDDDDNDYSLVASGGTTDALETALGHVDFARARGKTTHAWSNWNGEVYALHPMRRAQEAALLAGAGILYGAATYDEYVTWPLDARTAWEQVLVTVNANKALLPQASRTRVPVTDNNRAYAMRRTSKDGSQTALLVYLFSTSSANVTLNLAGTDLSLDQTPINLFDTFQPPPITGPSYTIAVPADGFRILQVTRQRPGATI